MKRLTKDIYYHTTSDGINIGCVVGDEAVVCIDLPLDPEEALAWKEQVQGLTDRPIRAVMLTSSDRLNSEAVEAFGVMVIGHSSAFVRPELPLELAPTVTTDHPQTVTAPLHTLPAVPQLTFDQSLSVSVSRQPPLMVDIVHQGGYALDASIVIPRGTGVLFAGGLVATGQPPALVECDFQKWLDILAELKKTREHTTVVPGRGPLASPLEAAEATADYIKTAVSRVKALVRANRTRSDLAGLAQELTAQYRANAPSDLPDADALTRIIRAGLERIYDDLKAGATL